MAYSNPFASAIGAGGSAGVPAAPAKKPINPPVPLALQLTLAEKANTAAQRAAAGAVLPTDPRIIKAQQAKAYMTKLYQQVHHPAPSAAGGSLSGLNGIPLLGNLNKPNAGVPTHGPGNPAWEAAHKALLARAAAGPGGTSGSGGGTGTTSNSAPAAGGSTPTSTTTLANGTQVATPPIIQSLEGTPIDWGTTSSRIQQLYAPALKSLADMQNMATHAATLRSADIQSYQDFVTKQADQAQALMAKTNQGYVGLVNNQAANVGQGLSDAQNIVAQNSQLASESGLAGAVEASGNTLGAAQATAQGAATDAQAQGQSALGGQQYAMDLASQERIAAQNAQSNLEINTFLPKILEIQQAIPAAVSGLYTTELQRQIEAGKIAMAGQIANIRVAGNQNVANTKAGSAAQVATIRSQASILNQGNKDATATQDTWIKANATQNVANIKQSNSGTGSFMKSIANGPLGTNVTWTAFAGGSYDTNTQAGMIAGALQRAKIMGVPKQTAVSAIFGELGGFGADAATLMGPQYQAQYDAAYNNAG